MGGSKYIVLPWHRAIRGWLEDFARQWLAASPAIPTEEGGPKKVRTQDVWDVSVAGSIVEPQSFTNSSNRPSTQDGWTGHFEVGRL